MAHDIFICYASADRPIADGVCARLEAAGQRCWIAPRDIPPGGDWGGAILAAVEASRALVLEFSTHAADARSRLRHRDSDRLRRGADGSPGAA